MQGQRKDKITFRNIAVTNWTTPTVIVSVTKPSVQATLESCKNRDKRITVSYYYYYYYYYYYTIWMSLSQAFLPGTSLEPAVIPTAHASSFTLQHFPYYVCCSEYSCLL